MTLYSVMQLPTCDRPRERLKRHGAAALTTAELIAIILGSGTKGAPVLEMAHALIARFETPQQLAEASLEELAQIKGLGPAKALQLKAALSLGMRVSGGKAPDKQRLDNPSHVYHFIRGELLTEKREVFIVILLDTKGFYLSHHTVAIGGLSSAPVHPREVFYPAIRQKAASIILVHNHPTGDPTPSPEDIETTKVLISAAELIGIPINDHVIVGHHSFASLRQQGLSF